MYNSYYSKTREVTTKIEIDSTNLIGPFYCVRGEGSMNEMETHKHTRPRYIEQRRN